MDCPFHLGTRSGMMMQRKPTFFGSCFKVSLLLIGLEFRQIEKINKKRVKTQKSSDWRMRMRNSDGQGTDSGL